MSSIWGKNLKLSVFGESHGAGIGVVLDGLPPGEAVDLEKVLLEMSRRAPGKDKSSTPRVERDIPEIISGLYKGRTTGTPLCAVIRNTDTRSRDYEALADIPRPGHADYTGRVRYRGFNDPRGGGHFSGRLTAPMVFAGAVCRQILTRRGIEIGAHIFSIHGVKDAPFDPARLTKDRLKSLSAMKFPVLNPGAESKMRSEIERAAAERDSVGGIVECAAAGLPAGFGSPIFDGVENRLSSIIFGIPAVRGIEFGAGFQAAEMYGSEHNDAFILENGRVKTQTNRHGGVLGGITSGMPLCFRTAFKPTPSIYKKQTSVDLSSMSGTSVEIKGRHDPCVVVRAVPVVEALTAVCLTDLLLEPQGAFTDASILERNEQPDEP